MLEVVFAALKAFLSDEEILELTYITCLYDMHAVMSRALRTEWDDRDDPLNPKTGKFNGTFSEPTIRPVLESPS